MGDDNAVHVEAAGHEFIAQAEDIHIVGDAQVVADFVFLDIDGTDHNDNLQIVFQLIQHLEFAVRLKTRQDAAGMVIVEQFPAEFHVQFVAEGCDAFLDAIRLDLDIFLVVVPVFHKCLFVEFNTGYKITQIGENLQKK